MSMYRTPYSAIGFAMLTVVCLWDLFADSSPSNEATYYYYKTNLNLPPHFAIAIPGIIILIMVPQIYNLVKYFNFYDILTALINIPILYGFITVLKPEEEKLITLNMNSTEFQTSKEIIKSWHTILVPLLAVSVILQLFASCSCDKDVKVKKNN